MYKYKSPFVEKKDVRSYTYLSTISLFLKILKDVVSKVKDTTDPTAVQTQNYV